MPLPPFKLTLPKPATYPYSTNPFGVRISDSQEVENDILCENKLVRRTIDNHLRVKEEKDAVKVLKPECPVINEPATVFIKGNVIRVKLG